MNYVKAIALFGLTIFLNSGVARAEYGTICARDDIHHLRICYTYFPSRSVAVTDLQTETTRSYALLASNPDISGPRYQEGDLFEVTYSFTAGSGRFTEVVEVVEVARYPGDGDTRVVKLKGLTPDGLAFEGTVENEG